MSGLGHNHQPIGGHSLGWSKTHTYMDQCRSAAPVSSGGVLKRVYEVGYPITGLTITPLSVVLSGSSERLVLVVEKPAQISERV